MGAIPDHGCERRALPAGKVTKVGPDGAFEVEATPMAFPGTVFRGTGVA